MIEIRISCKQCKAENLMPLADLSTGYALCKGCGDALFSYRGIAGFVYVLTNPSMPGMVKIGCTTRSVADRCGELNSATGVPSPFVVETYFESSEPEMDEAQVHKRLQSERVEGREFFRVSVPEAIQAIRSIPGPEAKQTGGQATCTRCNRCGHTWSPPQPKLDWPLRCPACGSYQAPI
jgi:T5orf172 domain